jgi:YegS/Rv2252/BmrU family lipid kinase
LSRKKIVFIVNPSSGGGRTGREWPRIRKIAEDRLGPFTADLTTGPGDAIRLTREHLLKGADVVVCVGGDGTLNEVINGFMDEGGPVRENALLGFVPNGTGCDFIKSVPIPKGIERSIDTIARGENRTIDLGRIQYSDHSNRTCVRYFHNVASFGLGGEVDERTNRTTKAFGPFLSFMISTLLSLLLYGKKQIRFRLDGGKEKDVTAWNIAVANGRFHGGGMLVAPGASVNDGLFHVTVIGDLSLAEALYHLPELYNGRIADVKNVSTFTCRRAEAFSDERVLLDVDGEQMGCLPAVIDILPGALRIIAGQ